MSFDDDDFKLHLSSDFEHSDDSWDELYNQNDISDDSDDYTSWKTDIEVSSESVASSDFSGLPSPPPHTFRLVQDEFADKIPTSFNTYRHHWF